MYFDSIENLDNLKSRYRDLTKKYHPDLAGGDTATMAKINAEYESALKYAKNFKGESLSHDDIEVEKIIMDIIQKTVALNGIVVELCGRWLWFTGDTWNHKDFLKTIGCFWARKKSAWYWRPDDAQVRSRRPLSLVQIRERHGSKVFAGVVCDRLSA